MSRPTAQRSLTLTEELEKLEQSITLTLQEIDSNFSKAHRIVTTSILPIVEQYAKHSSDVWEGSKFWKQFFEASANVSLSGYEEAHDDEPTQTKDSESVQTPTEHDDSTLSAELQHNQQDDDDDFSIESPTQVTGVQTTPKLPASTTRRTAESRGQASHNGTSYRSPSPRKYTGKNPVALATFSDQPSTPRMHSVAGAMQSSPFQPESAFRPSAFLPSKQNNDPLMHRVLDKNYRIQATPHTQRRTLPKPAATKPTSSAKPSTTRGLWEDSPQSSPITAAPELRSEIFSAGKRRPTGSDPPTAGPRTPGVSLLTPAHRKVTGPAPTTSTGRRLFSPEDKAYTATREQNRTRMSHMFENSDDSDEDDGFGGMSPPKTMQFHIPQSRLVQTPAREASKKIVEDLLLTAGADATDDIEDDGLEYEEPSPSVVRKAFDEDDTF